MTREFNEQHPRRGIVTNQPGTYDRNRAHAATIVCESAECRHAAALWVRGVTHETAYYVPDATRQPEVQR